jgi:hypothetical protein
MIFEKCVYRSKRDRSGFISEVNNLILHLALAPYHRTKAVVQYTRATESILVRMTEYFPQGSVLRIALLKCDLKLLILPDASRRRSWEGRGVQRCIT